MPLVTSKKQQQGGYEDMTASSLNNDFRSISSNIPEKMGVPLKEDEDRVATIRPDFYAPEKASRSERAQTQPAQSSKQNAANVYKRQEDSGKKLVVSSSMSGDDLNKVLDEVGAKRMRRGGRSGIAADVQKPSIPHRGGLLHSDGAGRTDILNRDVEAGSYVIPADVVSALGDGNTMAGARVLDQMMAEPQEKPQQFMNVPQPNYAPPSRGEAPVPIVAAGGEYIVSKAAIIAKFGSLDSGHDSLDEFVKMVRAKNVKKLSSLPAPRK